MKKVALLATALAMVTGSAFAADMGFRPGDTAGAERTLVGFDDYRDYPNLTRGLVARGYADDDIRAILGENALRVFKAVCG